MRSTAVAFLALAVACSAPSSPSELDVLVQPLVTEVVRAPTTVDIPFTVINRSARKAFVATCSDNLLTLVERLENGQWVAFAGGCDEFSPTMPAELPPGRRISGTVRVSEAGIFRIRVILSAEVQTGFVAGKPSALVLVR